MSYGRVFLVEEKPSDFFCDRETKEAENIPHLKQHQHLDSYQAIFHNSLRMYVVLQAVSLHEVNVFSEIRILL